MLNVENNPPSEVIEKTKSEFGFVPSNFRGLLIAIKKPMIAKGNAKMVWLNFIRDK